MSTHVDTMNYYNTHGDAFYLQTYAVSMHDIYEKFEALLPDAAHILDAGCGSGRDTKYFDAKGYRVDAMDASSVMVAYAKQYTQCAVQQMRFDEIEACSRYDAIWSCASLLHVPKQELPGIIPRFIRALKSGGIWYLSFKYGAHERTKEGRHFSDFTPETLRSLFEPYTQLDVVSFWLSDDRRANRSDKWLNVLFIKTA